MKWNIYGDTNRESNRESNKESKMQSFRVAPTYQGVLVYFKLELGIRYAINSHNDLLLLEVTYQDFARDDDLNIWLKL